MQQVLQLNAINRNHLTVVTTPGKLISYAQKKVTALKIVKLKEYISLNVNGTWEHHRLFVNLAKDIYVFSNKAMNRREKMQ